MKEAVPGPSCSGNTLSQHQPEARQLTEQKEEAEGTAGHCGNRSPQSCNAGLEQASFVGVGAVVCQE